MKIRSGFVSNSSSSSFIILYNDDNVEFTGASGGRFKFRVEKLLDLIERFSCAGSCETEINALYKEAVIQDIKKWWGWSSKEDDECLKLIETIKNSEYENCAYFSISYHDDMIMRLFKCLIDENALKVVYSSEDREKEELRD